MTSPSAADRLEYLDALLGLSVDFPRLYAITPASITWTNTSAFRREVAEHRDRLEERHRRFVSLLVSHGLLTAQEARLLEPEIDIDVIDERKDKSEPLPVISRLGGGGLRR